MRLGIKVPPGEITLEQLADDAFKKNARGALKRASDVLLKHVQFQLQRRIKQPSAPGEPPARQTGDLVKSFKRLRPRLRKAYGSSGITSDKARAYALEYGEARLSRTAGAIAGRKGRSAANKLARTLSPLFGDKVYRVAPRPYLKPAQDEADDEITRVLEDVVRFG